MGERAAIYIRYSSHKQESGYTIDFQKEHCENYALKHGLDIQDYYIDEAQTGRNTERKAFQRMMLDAAQKNFEKVIVWKFDRFSRDRFDAPMFKRELQKYGIDVLSTVETVDPDSDMAPLMESIYEALAHVESNQIARRTIAGMIQGAKKGYWQNGQPPFGYGIKKVDDTGSMRNKLEPRENEALIVKKIFNMYANGQGTPSIAQALNDQGLRTRQNRLFSSVFVTNIIKNQVYTGTFNFTPRKAKFDPIRITNCFPNIVTQEEYLKANETIHNRNRGRGPSGEYVLTGVMTCGCCGGSFIGRSATSGSGKRHFYYECSNRSKRGKLACSSSRINRDELDLKVLDGLVNRVKSANFATRFAMDLWDAIQARHNDNIKEISILETELIQSKNKYSRLVDSLESGALSLEDLADPIKKRRTQIEQIESRLRFLTKSLPDLPKNLSDTEIIDFISTMVIEVISETEISHKTVKRFIKGITIKGKDATINYSLDRALETVRSSQKVNAIKNRSSNLKDGEPDRNHGRTSLLHDNLWLFPIYTFKVAA